MPLVRIDLQKGKDAAYRKQIGRVVYEAMVGVGVPADDRFQVLSEHDADNFLFDPDYLGIHRTDDLVIIQITWNEGRTVEQKKQLYKAIAEGLAKSPGVRPEDVSSMSFNCKRSNDNGQVAEKGGRGYRRHHGNRFRYSEAVRR